MKSYDVIGYAYDADLHCLDCTARAFPKGASIYDRDPYDLIDAIDGPVFVDQAEEDDECGDCFVNLLTGDLPAWVAGNPDHYRALTGLEAS